MIEPVPQVPLQRRPVLRAACVVAGCDYDVARQCNYLDRMTICSNALVLLLVGTLAMVAWSATLTLLMSPSAAIAMALLPAGMIFMLDRQISASDWDYAGILRNEPHTSAYWTKLTLRVAISGCLSLATSTGLTLWMFGDEIGDWRQRQRVAANQPLREEYDRAKRDAASRLVTPLQAELKILAQEREDLLRSMNTSATTMEDAQHQASAMRIEAGREVHGDVPGYHPGFGPRYREAERQRLEAERREATARSRADAAHARLDGVIARIDDKTAQLKVATRELAVEQGRLDAAFLADQRYVPERRGFLGAHMALEALMADAQTGPTVRKFYWLCIVTLMVLELCFLLIKTGFAYATVYTVRLRARTQHEAAQVSHEYADNVSELRARRKRPDWRVVNGDGAQSDHFPPRNRDPNA